MLDEAPRIPRWVAETVKPIVYAGLPVVLFAVASCTGLGDVLGGLGGFSEDNPQQAPVPEVGALHELTVRLEYLADDLQCPADYLAKEKELDLLAGAMADAQRECTADIKELVDAVNNAETRADEAEARAELAEADLAKIRSLLQPAAEAAEGASE